MPINETPSLQQAVTEFLSESTDKTKHEIRQSLNRFTSWCGRDRKTSEVPPNEIAEYAQRSSSEVNATRKRARLRSFLLFLEKREYITVPLAPHLRAVKSKKRTLSVPRKVQEASVLTPDGHAQLQAELELLKDSRVTVVEDIQKAMADKDFKENSPLDAAKERQGYIESSIRELENTLANAIISNNVSKHKDKKVSLGKTVVLKDLQSTKQLTYTLVDSREVDVSLGKISPASPVGRALIDRLEGEEIHITAPRGDLHYLIKKVKG